MVERNPIVIISRDSHFKTQEVFNFCDRWSTTMTAMQIDTILMCHLFWIAPKHQHQYEVNLELNSIDA